MDGRHARHKCIVTAALSRTVDGKVNGVDVVLHDSISTVGDQDCGQVIVTGSHGGTSAAEYAMRYPPVLVFFNDAGIGKNAAGIAALGVLDALGIAAGAVDSSSAEIGNARDMWENGILSNVNTTGHRVGLRPGQAVQDAIRLFGR